MTSTRHQCCQSVALYLITANNVGQRLVSNSGQFELGHSLILVNLSLGTKSLQWNVGCGRECSKGGMGRYGTPFILMIPECRGKSTTVIVAICSPQHPTDTESAASCAMAGGKAWPDASSVRAGVRVCATLLSGVREPSIYMVAAAWDGVTSASELGKTSMLRFSIGSWCCLPPLGLEFCI